MSRALTHNAAALTLCLHVGVAHMRCVASRRTVPPPTPPVRSWPRFYCHADVAATSSTSGKMAHPESDRSDSSNSVREVPLDMDVIDTSWMDSNVHAMRHNFFNVNR